MKRYFFILLVSVFCFYFLFSGLFGERGYLYNKSLEKQIIEKKHQSEKLNVIIENLKEQRKQLSSEEGLRDSAIDLGYYVEGDTVYRFDTSAIQPDLIDNEKESEQKFYQPLSTTSLIFLSLGVSCVITFVIWFFSEKTHDKNDDEDDEQLLSSDNDSDLFINA